ncbi:MAG: hypothetical protein Q7J13_10450 [Brevundimonas sp.]|uniref:hypothetical protein n=1 Tax=Brevundimonas sp. TaxID=1871086 RepID=UPI0027201298|nr:hypothetical protein [Brevundimonas sp.]MDO9588341.1 hypothetical protein [Brevundimonas sp.]
MTDRAIRNLAHLRRSASTARVLNLLKVSRDNRGDPAWADRPVFRTEALNCALIIKHRLRRDELDAFHLRPQVATKVVIPIDAADLKTGGRYFFVNQKRFEQTLQETFGLEPDHPELTTLRLMDALPSLDPFLLREQLRRAGMDPAPCYFSISESDLARMIRFVEAEVRPLVTLSVGEDLEAVGSTRRLAGMILSNAPGARMEALRHTLHLRTEEYQEGLFCWKGFLYYKWVLDSLSAELTAVSEAVATVKPVGRVDRTSREYLDRGRRVLGERIAAVSEDAARTLRVYDAAYEELTRDSCPAAFRDFLLEAPRLFTRLGEQLGAIQHVVSFWRFRFSPGAAPVGVEELIDVFMDFETGLADRHHSPGRQMLAA